MTRLNHFCPTDSLEIMERNEFLGQSPPTTEMALCFGYTTNAHSPDDVRRMATAGAQSLNLGLDVWSGLNYLKFVRKPRD